MRKQGVSDLGETSPEGVPVWPSPELVKAGAGGFLSRFLGRSTMELGEPLFFRDIGEERLQEFAGPSAAIPAEIPAESVLAPEAPMSREEKMAAIQQEIQRISQTISGLTPKVQAAVSAARPTTTAREREEEPEVPEGYIRDPEHGRLIKIEDTEPKPPAINHQEIVNDLLKNIQNIRGDLAQDIKDILATSSTETAQQIIDRLYPELPEKVTELDQKLAQLDTQYRLQREQIMAQPYPGGILRGQEALAYRQYEIKRQGLLMEREALMGDYDRAVERANTVLGLEMKMREEERENQRLAIDLLMQEADTEEAIQLEMFKRQLDRAEEGERREYEQAIKELDAITAIMAKDPAAFIGYGMPKSVDEAIRIAGERQAALEAFDMEMELAKLASTTIPAPKTLTTDEGIFQWDTATGRWVDTGLDKPKTKAEREVAAEALYNLSRIDKAIEWLKAGEVATGPVRAALSAIGKYSPFHPFRNERQREFEALLGDIATEKLFSIGGKVLPAQEIARIERGSVPKITYDEKENLSRLVNYRQELETIYKRNLGVGGEEAKTAKPIILQDPRTGEIRQWDNLSPEDLADALNQGYILLTP